jgi:hypothetical protein
VCGKFFFSRITFNLANESMRGVLGMLNALTFKAGMNLTDSLAETLRELREQWLQEMFGKLVVKITGHG